MKKRHSIFAALAIAATAFCATVPVTSYAASVSAGSVVPVSGTSHASDPTLGGDIIYDELLPFSISFATGSTISGWLQDRVVLNSLGTLDFYAMIRIDDSKTSAGVSIDSFTRGLFTNFPGPGSDAVMDFRPIGDSMGSVAPAYAGRAFDSSSATFYFNPGSGPSAGMDPCYGGAPGGCSLFMFYRTDATNFDLNGNGYLFGIQPNVAGVANRPFYGVSNTLHLAEPTAPVPEPETYAMLMAGLGMVGVMARRRKNTAA
jgi:hypothetical protein